MVEETDLYRPIANNVYDLVNLAAEALGLNVICSKAKGKVAKPKTPFGNNLQAASCSQNLSLHQQAAACV